MTFGEELFVAWQDSNFICEAVADKLANSARIFFVGNGGSAAIASHMANDFSKNGGVPSLAFNDGAAVTCLSNDYGFHQVFSRPIQQHLAQGDTLVAISSSGRSSNIVAAILAARDKGAFVITMSGFDADNQIFGMGDINIHVPSHDYGIVETCHLGMLHAALGEIQNARR